MVAHSCPMGGLTRATASLLLLPKYRLGGRLGVEASRRRLARRSAVTTMIATQISQLMKIPFGRLLMRLLVQLNI
jgi:hypothetical protein